MAFLSGYPVTLLTPQAFERKRIGYQRANGNHGELSGGCIITKE
jgi:hypothetical protein